MVRTGRKRLALGALGALALLGWLGLRPRAHPDVEQPASSGSAATADAARSWSAHERATTASPQDAGARVLAAETPTARALDPLVAPEGGLLVRVLDARGAARGGVPVALAADVPGGPRAAPVVRATTRAPDGLAALAGDLRAKKLPPGVRFRAVVALPHEPPIARELGAWVPGEPWTGGTIELALDDAAEAWLAPLEVEVVDARGAPVEAAPVELVGRIALVSNGASTLGRATTDARGLASLARDEWIERLDHARLMGFALEVEARCAGPFLAPPSAKVGTSTSRARVTLPPTGVVEVRLARDGGAPTEDASVRLLWRAPGEEHRLGAVTARARDGVAVFGRVGLGLELELSATLPGAGASAPVVRRAGPTRGGETVVVELAFGPDHPLLVGRLVDERGAPAGASLWWLGGIPIASDGGGRFELPWPTPPSRWPATLRLEERPDPKRGAPEGWVPRWAEVALPRATGKGRIEVGDVALREVPVVVAGRVVEPDGRPSRRTWLDVRASRDERDPAAWTNLRIPGLSRAATRDDGTFELRSLDDARAIQVAAVDGAGRGGEGVVVAPGTRGVVVVRGAREDLERTLGTVEGSVALDEGTPSVWIEATLARGGRSSPLLAGRFRIARVEPGEYRLALRTADTRWELAAVERVVVEAGVTTQDARLEGLDLRGRTRIWKLVLADAAGRALARARVRVSAQGGGGRLETGDDGRLAFLAPSSLDAVELELDGRPAASVPWSAVERTVVLEGR